MTAQSALAPDDITKTVLYRTLNYLYEAGFSADFESDEDDTENIKITYHYKGIPLSADVNEKTIDALAQVRANLEAVHELKPTRTNWAASFTGLLFVAKMNKVNLAFDYKDESYPQSRKFSKAQRDAIKQLFAECGISEA